MHSSIGTYIPRLFSELPWPARWALIIGGTLVSALAGRLPDAWQDIGLYCGLAALIYGALASIWHWINAWRRNRGAQEFALGGTHLVIFLLAAILSGGGIYLWASKIKAVAIANLQAEINAKDVTIDELKGQNQLMMYWRTEFFEMGNKLAKVEKELSGVRSDQALRQALPQMGSFSNVRSKDVRTEHNIDECDNPSDKAFMSFESTGVVTQYNYHHCSPRPQPPKR